MKILKIIVATILLIGFTGLGLNNLVDTDNKFRFKEVELKSTTAEIQELNLKYNRLNKQLEHTENVSDKELKKIQKEKSELEREKQKLERELQAKLEAKKKQKEAIAKASDKAINTLTGTQTASASSGGTKEQWMASAGIPKSDWQYVDYIVSKESGWDPCAYNPSLSDCSANPTSACGLAQSLPCGKQSKYGHWTDPVANLKWQYEYVKGRYGGYAQAYAFWIANKWY